MTNKTTNKKGESETMSKKMIIATMPRSAWEAAQKSGSYAPPALATIGFIHCSFAEQMEKVANAKLQGQNDLVLLVVDPDKLKSEVRYEKSTTWTNEFFPHIYGPLNTDAVVKEYPFQTDAKGVFTLPKALSGKLRSDFGAAVLKVGDHLKDGTVVFHVDLKTNTALFVPEEIFGGKTDFSTRYKVIQQANAQSLHGHKDWRGITDKEAGTLAVNWNKVSQGKGQWFWGDKVDGNFVSVPALAYRGGELGADKGKKVLALSKNSGVLALIYRDNTLQVPLVRSGPARL